MRLFLALLSLIALVTPAWACPTGFTCATYLTFSGESVLAPSGDATGATDVAAINAAIVQNKPNNTQTVVRLGTGTFYINSTQIMDWPYTTIEGHYLSSADGSTGTPGGTLLQAAGSWSSTITDTGPAVINLTDRNTLRNLTVRGQGGSTLDCIRGNDFISMDAENVDVVNCNYGWNALGTNTLAGCGAPPYYPHQNCISGVEHWFLGNVIGNNVGIAIGALSSSFTSDSFDTGVNFYNNVTHISNLGGCGDALGVSWNFGELSNATGAGISNACNMWSVVGNQIENANPPLYEDRVGAYQPFPIAGNQIGNFGTSAGPGPLMHVTSGFGGSVSGNIWYSGCPYQVDSSISGLGLAWYETPVASFAYGCSSGSTTNLDSIIIVPGTTFP